VKGEKYDKRLPYKGIFTFGQTKRIGERPLVFASKKDDDGNPLLDALVIYFYGSPLV